MGELTGRKGERKSFRCGEDCTLPEKLKAALGV